MNLFCSNSRNSFLEYLIEKKFTFQSFTQNMISNVLLDRIHFKLKLLINRSDLHFIADAFFFSFFGENVKLNQLLFVTTKKELIRLNVTSIGVICIT